MHRHFIVMRVTPSHHIDVLLSNTGQRNFATLIGNKYALKVYSSVTGNSIK